MTSARGNAQSVASHSVKKLSFRPKPERQRRRSGGTCCFLSVLGAPLPSSAKNQTVIPTEAGAQATAQWRNLLFLPLPGAPLPLKTKLSFRPKPERKRRRSGGTCCFFPYRARPCPRPLKTKLSFRPKPERKRRRSGGTCCFFPYRARPCPRPLKTKLSFQPKPERQATAQWRNLLFLPVPGAPLPSSAKNQIVIPTEAGAQSDGAVEEPAVSSPAADCARRPSCYTPRMTTDPAITVREATPSDIPDILRQRRAMYEAMNDTDTHALDAMIEATSLYLPKALADGSFHAWLALNDAHAVAGGAVIISPWPAHPYDLQCRRATILNVYTDPDYRRRGIASQLLHTMIDWCKQQGLARVDPPRQRRRPPSLRIPRLRPQQRNAPQTPLTPRCPQTINGHGFARISADESKFKIHP